MKWYFTAFIFIQSLIFNKIEAFGKKHPLLNTNIIVLSQMFECDSNIHQLTRNQIHSCLEFLTSCLLT